MAAGFLSRVVPLHRAAVLAVLLALGGSWPGVARAATTTITGPWAGGTILPADTVVLANGASVTGNVIANGTLQFAQTGSLTIGTTLSGTGTLALANTGTLTLSAINFVGATGTGTLLDLTTSVPMGTLVLGATGGPATTFNAVMEALAPLGITSLPMPATPHAVFQAIRSARKG